MITCQTYEEEKPSSNRRDECLTHTSALRCHAFPKHITQIMCDAAQVELSICRGRHQFTRNLVMYCATQLSTVPWSFPETYGRDERPSWLIVLNCLGARPAATAARPTASNVKHCQWCQNLPITNYSPSRGFVLETCEQSIVRYPPKSNHLDAYPVA